MSGLTEYIKELSINLNKLGGEMNILTSSLQNTRDSKEAMKVLIEASENEMRTKSPLYQNVEQAEKMQRNELVSYIDTRIKQVVGDE